MDKIFLKFNKKDCMGCHACEVACKQEHELGVGPRLIKVIENSYEFTPIYCHQCAKAPCKEECPVEAISRNKQGIVLINEDACIGCRACVDVCPFEAMQYEDNRDVAVKCDLCVDRIEEGKQTACMVVCPTRCIRLGGKKSVAAVFEK